MGHTGRGKAVAANAQAPSAGTGLGVGCPGGAYLKRAEVGGELGWAAQRFHVQIAPDDQGLAVRADRRESDTGVKLECPAATRALGRAMHGVGAKTVSPAQTFGGSKPDI